MASIAELAQATRDAMVAGAATAAIVGPLMSKNFALRRQLYGECAGDRTCCDVQQVTTEFRRRCFHWCDEYSPGNVGGGVWSLRKVPGQWRCRDWVRVVCCAHRAESSHTVWPETASLTPHVWWRSAASSCKMVRRRGLRLSNICAPGIRTRVSFVWNWSLLRRIATAPWRLNQSFVIDHIFEICSSSRSGHLPPPPMLGQAKLILHHTIAVPASR